MKEFLEKLKAYLDLNPDMECTYENCMIIAINPESRCLSILTGIDSSDSEYVGDMNIKNIPDLFDLRKKIDLKEAGLIS